MTRSVTISEVRNNLTRLPARFMKEPVAIEITRRGRPVMALLPWDLYESLVETLDVLADEEVVKALRRSVRDIRKGKTHSTAEIERKLGL